MFEHLLKFFKKTKREPEDDMETTKVNLKKQKKEEETETKERTMEEEWDMFPTKADLENYESSSDHDEEPTKRTMAKDSSSSSSEDESEEDDDSEDDDEKESGDVDEKPPKADDTKTSKEDSTSSDDDDSSDDESDEEDQKKETSKKISEMVDNADVKKESNPKQQPKTSSTLAIPERLGWRNTAFRGNGDWNRSTGTWTRRDCCRRGPCRGRC